MFDAAESADAVATELATALDAITIVSPASFTFNDGPVRDVAPSALSGAWGGPPAGGGDAEAALTRALQDALYDGAYAHRLNAPRPTPATRLADDPAFAAALAAANPGREHWEAGWVVQQVAPNGQVFVRKGERERIAMPGAFISAIAPGMAIQPGGAVLLRAPVGALGVQPGYYFVFGETLDEMAEQLSLVRFYFHCRAADAATLLHAVTTRLNRFQLPFQMKFPSAPGLYERNDTAVLYLATRYVPIALRLIDAARTTVPLDPAVPLFARRLWPGIGGAVDPGNGESFGAHRCRLTAAGIVAAWRAGRQDHAARREAVAAQFASAGLDLARPWRGAGGIDPFRSPPAEGG
jgi:HopA1 effector protein family